MDFAPAPTLISTVVSFFRKPAQQPKFTPAAPPVFTQVLITRDTTTHVDPPVGKKYPTPLKCMPREKPSAPLHCMPGEKYPETPCAPHPHRMTFFGDVRYKDSDSDSDSVSLSSSEGPSTEGRIYEPKTLARALFFFGFLFPPFWIAGLAILVMPLRTTVDWECGRSKSEITWGRNVIRDAELRWAKRCLVALVSEAVVVLIIVVIIKWGISTSD